MTEDAIRTPSIETVIARSYLRMVLLAVGLCALALTIIGGYLIRGYADQTLELAARTISYSVEPALVFDDASGVQEALRSVGSMDAVRRIEVYALDGQAMGKWEAGSNNVAGSLYPVVDRLFWPGPRDFDVIYNGQKIGVVRLVGGSGALAGYVFIGMIVALACLVATFAAMQVMARRLRSEVSRPLNELAVVAEAVRKERAFHRRVAPTGIAEFDGFANDFNVLISEMESWHSQLTATNRDLAHRVEHDALTGLGNRLRFKRVVETSLAIAKDTGASFSILFIDLDRFKKVNDTFGHAAGDFVLTNVAHRLLACVRGSDHVCRLGGDEFAVVMDPSGSMPTVATMIRRIETTMATPLRWEDKAIIPTEMSIGSATYPDHGNTVEALMGFADTRMYSKKRGE